MYSIRNDPKKRTRRALHLKCVVSAIRVILKTVIVHAKGISVYRVHLTPPFAGSDTQGEDTSVAPAFTELFQRCSALSWRVDRGVKANGVPYMLVWNDPCPRFLLSKEIYYIEPQEPDRRTSPRLGQRPRNEGIKTGGFIDEAMVRWQPKVVTYLGEVKERKR